MTQNSSTQPNSTCLSAEHPVNRFRQPDYDTDSMIPVETWPSSLSDLSALQNLHGSSGKMSLVYYQQTKEEHSNSSPLKYKNAGIVAAGVCLILLCHKLYAQTTT